LHPLRRRGAAPARLARCAPAPHPSAAARLHALDLDAARRPRPALGQRAAPVSLVVGAPGSAAAGARVLAPPRRRGGRHGPRRVRRGARAGAGEGGCTVSGVPESPYKGLASFEDSELDALLFFGREREIAAVAANVLASRLTVLYGPSGVGKSSLLYAGVARRLRELGEAPGLVDDTWAEEPAGRG